MEQEHYKKALKLGQRELRTSMLHGKSGIMAVMPESMENGTLRRESLGLVEIPLDLIAGTCTDGRSNAFSLSFYPLMPEKTEFSSKWINLCKAHLTEGLRDPIKAVEYMGKFYVIEGHKRVSVLKYFGAVSIIGSVTRLYPADSDDINVKIYNEFLQFYNLTGMYIIQFNRLGGYSQLLEVMGFKQDAEWSAELIRDFRTFYSMFSSAFRNQGGDSSQTPEALIAYLRIYDFESSKRKVPSQIEKELEKIKPEIARRIEQSGMTLMLDSESKKSLFSGLISTKLKVAFIYGNLPEDSTWIYAHELGRRDAEAIMNGQISTMVYGDVQTEENAVKAMEQAVENGADVIFAPEPQMVRACVQIAAKYPDVKVLNCSLNTVHNMIRTYYLRMYEAKFLAGALAGSLTPDDRIAYLCGKPTEGSVASINAFARGAEMTNPRAKIYLEWVSDNTEQGVTDEKMFYMDDFDLLPVPTGTPRAVGLYDNTGKKPKNLAIAIGRWGKFYQKLLYRILDGNWKSDAKGSSAISYWWGMDSGVVEVIYSRSLPDGVRQLAELLKEAICSGRIGPFTGTLKDQNGDIKYSDPIPMKPQDILKMDWLAENVIGILPEEEKSEEQDIL
ncbi:MAG TPA: BMP family ABC transporter substrate-binding protein [Candidatus Butyricicoccus avistercoris]|uniref:BMP family ABC transporter substrate-binding protein n=1 Tax=Candidatus Butyricicoccus avistercoris TaxID=2838518 RepID=A0A9D1TH74_9FIRM|nr:BMP family ABC transporter substrate-binding protein [Candidatus Butyricicoccus avistercoris]